MQNDDQYEYRLVAVRRVETADLYVKFPKGTGTSSVLGLDAEEVIKTHAHCFSAWIPIEEGYSWAYAEPIAKEEAEQHSVYELPVK